MVVNIFINIKFTEYIKRVMHRNNSWVRNLHRTRTAWTTVSRWMADTTGIPQLILSRAQRSRGPARREARIQCTVQGCAAASTRCGGRGWVGACWRGVEERVHNFDEIQQVMLSHVPNRRYGIYEGALTQGPNPLKAIHHADKINVFRNTFLPTLPDLPGVPDTDIINRFSSKVHWTLVRKSAI